MADIRSLILEAQDIDSEVLTIPEWGDVKIEVRGMSGRERARFQRELANDNFDMESWYTELTISSVYDPDTGERVFNNDDTEQLASKSAKVLERIADTATRLSGMRPEAIDKAEEELGKTPS